MTKVYERTDRAFVRVHGRDPVKMMQGLLTNDLAGSAPDRAVYAAMLTPKGRMVADLRAFRQGADVILECHVDALDNVLGHIKKFVPPLFARASVDETLQMSSLHGADSARIAGAVVPHLPGGEDDIVTHEDLVWIGSRYTGDMGFDVIGPLAPRATLNQSLVAAGAMFGQMDELERLRVEAGTPRWGAELDETVIPIEAGLLERAISQNKGCYTGQEVIIRILHRGHVNRHLRGVLLGVAAPPAKGTPLIDASGKQVGQITSAVTSTRLGQTVGLAYVRREVTLPAQLGDVTVVELPFTREA